MKKISKPAPKHLSSEAAKIWKEILAEYSIDDAAGLRILRVALESFDRTQTAREAIDRDGLTVIDKAGQVKSHPLLPIERDSRAAFLAGLKALSLDIEPLRDRPGRPAGR
jgi:P27 family predicted phage terminase small subunit